MILSTHPSYHKHKDQWLLLRDFNEGEQHVKAKEDLYLKPTAGMVLDGMLKGQPGRLAYESFLERAVFPDYIKDAVEIYIGLLHQKESVIELPPELEPLRANASIKGESLDSLLRRIHAEQILQGRCGILVDPPDKDSSLAEKNLPFLSLYAAESIFNWDESNDSISTDKVNMVVLDETGPRRDAGTLTWKIVNQHRILDLDESGVYRQGLFLNNSSQYDESAMIYPAVLGRTLKEIPFVFANSKDLLPEPENSPLLGLANIVWSIYRGEADYRYSLFMQGQDTLVVIGSVRNPNSDPTGTEAIRTGAGSRIDIDLNGDAKYIGVSSKGLAEQRVCLENDRKRAETQSGRLIGTKSNVESGEALRVRLAAQTATLNQIALTGALALENSLKIIARWKGVDESKVKVIPNMDFADIQLQGQELVNLLNARSLGAPISIESIHKVLVNRGLTNLDYNTELSKIKSENKLLGLLTPKDSAPSNQPNNPPKQISNP
jgi:hypothetical protein